MDELSFPLLFFLWINRIKKQKRDGERSVEREREREMEKEGRNRPHKREMEKRCVGIREAETGWKIAQ